VEGSSECSVDTNVCSIFARTGRPVKRDLGPGLAGPVGQNRGVPTPITLEDPADERFLPYRSLNDPGNRMQFERSTGLLVVEGLTAIGRLLASTLTIESILVTPNKLQRLETVLAAQAVTTYVATRKVLATVAGFDIHRGAIAIARRPPQPSLDHLLATSRTIAVLEGLTDHENLGSIARAARAFGVDALVLDPRCADPFYRRAIRVSMGEMLHLPIVRATSWPEPLTTMRDREFRVLGLSAEGPTSIDDIHRTAHDRVAIVLGAEGPGLSAEVRALVPELVAIPISATVDSLNVGQAAAIAFHMLNHARRN
jgi:tRNA G18 (ribose-2'-O)-methylase SpoU